MLSKQNARILRWFAANDSHWISGDPRPEWITDVRIESLVQSGLLSEEPYKSVPVYRISPSGEDALAEYQRIEHEMRKQRAKDVKREKRRIQERREDRIHDWIIALFSFATGTGLTLIVEHVLIPLLSTNR